jgi:hypothetical protein
MTRKQSMTLDAAQRALQFFDAHEDTVGDSVTTVRALIARGVADFEAFQLEQQTAIGQAQGETMVQENMRKDIAEHFLKPSRTVANSFLRESPDRPLLKVRSRIGRDGDFVTKVTSLANAAEKNEAAFLTAGVQPDFLAQLDAALGDLMKSTDTRGRLYCRRAAATEGLKVTDKALRLHLFTATSVLRVVLAKKPDVFADWMASSTIRQVPVEMRRSTTIKLVGQSAVQAARLQASATEG